MNIKPAEQWVRKLTNYHIPEGFSGDITNHESLMIAFIVQIQK